MGGFFGCMGLLRLNNESAGVGIVRGTEWGGGCAGGGEGQPLSTDLHTISISLQNSFCESHT